MRSEEKGKPGARAARVAALCLPVSLFLCLGLFAAPTPAPLPKESLTLRWQPGVYHIGDSVPFEVAVPVPSREFYVQSELAEGEEWGPAVISEVRQVLPDRFPGLVVLSGKAQIFQLGSASLPPVRLGLHLASATHAYTVQAPPLSIAPLLPPGDQPRPPVAAPIPLPEPFPWGLVLGGVLAAAALACGIWVWARRRRAKGAQSRALPEVREADPDRWVRDEIDRIFRAPLEFPQRYQRLSEALREYLSLRFARPYLEWTTLEVARGLQQEAALEGRSLEDAVNLFAFCDLAMFARYRPLPEEERDARDIALDLVDWVSHPTGLEQAS